MRPFTFATRRSCCVRYAARGRDGWAPSWDWHTARCSSWRRTWCIASIAPCWNSRATTRGPSSGIAARCIERYWRLRACAQAPAISAEIDLGFQIRTRVRVQQGFFEFDAILLVEVQQRHVEALHAAFGAGNNRFLDRADIALLHELADVGGVQHDFDGRDALAFLGYDKALRADGAQVLRQVQEDLLVLVLREHVDDAIHRLGAVVRMQRGQNQVAGTGKGYRRLHRLLVADFTNEDDIGSGAHHATKRARE